jgi:cell wall-associated NlpC family hydrolase
MAGNGISGAGLAAILAGSVFLYAGLKGKTVLGSVQAVISGKSPSTGPGANPITGSTNLQLGGGSAPGSTTNSAIANDAMKYNGSPYVWGGAPAHNIGPTGIGDHDCSSLVNWVLGHDLGLDIPGFSTYNGSEHGPTTTSYLIWGGGTHIKRSECTAGDLVVGYSHMGIALDNATYISAHDEASGTGVSNIDPFPDATYSIIRVNAALTSAQAGQAHRRQEGPVGVPSG